jgi:hypothetical protein
VSLFFAIYTTYARILDAIKADWPKGEMPAVKDKVNLIAETRKQMEKHLLAAQEY